MQIFPQSIAPGAMQQDLQKFVGNATGSLPV